MGGSLLVFEVDPRGVVPYPSQKRGFIVLQSAYVVSTSRHKHKQELKARILRLHDEGFSLREIAQQVDLHWSRVWQLLKDIKHL